ncbi:MAG: V-type ATP synthase subunit F [Acidaminobacteraceae bacterium]
MKSLLISMDQDTVIGMRLAGITGEVISDKEKILDRINKAINDTDIGIILISKEVLAKAEKEIMDLKLKSEETLIIQIPDLGDTMEDYISRYVRESIGIKF